MPWVVHLSLWLACLSHWNPQRRGLWPLWRAPNIQKIMICPVCRQYPILSAYLCFLSKAAPEHPPGYASAWMSTSCRQRWGTSLLTNTESICEPAHIKGLRAHFKWGGSGTDNHTPANTWAEHALQSRSRTLSTYWYLSFKFYVTTYVLLFVSHAG